ncbi:MAG: protease modulator HflC [Novosphingobium sp.]|nr:protease modulator HflC [Novosphingobium sp.]
MTQLLHRNRALLFVFGTIALLLGLCVTVVPETSQAVVLRMGEPVRVVNRWQPDGAPGGGGLLAHWPFVESVAWVDRGLASVKTGRVAVRSADQQLLELDTTATYRVFDPARLIDTAGSNEQAIQQIRSALSALAQQELGQAEAGRLLMPGGGGTAARLRAALDAKARPLGVQIIDVRLSGAALPASELQETYERMEGERTRIAAIEAEQATHEALRIADQGRADAARILGAAAGKDPAFYDFYRAMRSYETVFAGADRKQGTTIVLGPDAEYLKQFRGQ